jgi:hypothetical protein
VTNLLNPYRLATVAATPALVQAIAHAGGNPTATPTLGAAATAGSLLVMVSSSVTSLSAPAGSGWTRLGPSIDSTTYTDLAFKIAAGGETSDTVTGGGIVQASLAEFTAMTTTQNGTFTFNSAGTTVTSLALGAITTTVPVLLLAAIGLSGLGNTPYAFASEALTADTVLTYTVPEDQSSLIFDMAGAGAKGILVRMPVTPGEDLQVVVGGSPVVPDEPEEDGYWTIAGGYNGGGSSRTTVRPGFIFSDPTVRNGFSVAGGGSSEVRRAGERIAVAPGVGGGWTDGGTPVFAESPTPTFYETLPAETDPPRVPYEPTGSDPVVQLAGIPGAEVQGGFGFDFYGHDRFGLTSYEWRLGGGGGFGGGASSTIYTDGTFPGGDDPRVFSTHSRAGGWHVSPGVDFLTQSIDNLMSPGFVVVYREVIGAGWGMGHMAY